MRVIIALPRIYPADLVAPFLGLPERGVGFQEVHNILRRIEGGLPVRGGYGDKNDLLAGNEPTNPVNDCDVNQRPAIACFGLDAGYFLFGHPRIMFQRHCGDIVIFAQAAHCPNK